MATSWPVVTAELSCTSTGCGVRDAVVSCVIMAAIAAFEVLEGAGELEEVFAGAEVLGSARAGGTLETLASGDDESA